MKKKQTRHRREPRPRLRLLRRISNLKREIERAEAWKAERLDDLRWVNEQLAESNKILAELSPQLVKAHEELASLPVRPAEEGK
jgi:hypothetical protein